MVMGPVSVGRFQIGLDRILVSGGVALQFTAGAQALVGLDMRAGRDLLQKHFDRFRTFFALECQYASGFEHDDDVCGGWKARILSSRVDGSGQLKLQSGVNRTGSYESVPRPGCAMTQQKQPSKESVRKWLRAQIDQRRPPPDPQQIRRELGWELIKLPVERKR